MSKAPQTTKKPRFQKHKSKYILDGLEIRRVNCNPSLRDTNDWIASVKTQRIGRIIIGCLNKNRSGDGVSYARR